MEDERFEDRARIERLAIAYAYAVDEKDWRAFEDLYVPDALIDYRSAGGIAGTPAEVAAWMEGAMAMFAWSMHSISTQRIEFTGPDTATGSVHVFARHGLEWEGVEELMDVSAVYHDSYVRTASGWRFSKRREQTHDLSGGRFAALVRASLTR
ncbi:MAG TPA: nuclear transport factor 2 family protein [Acidimicrobiia bacterium]|nr:nuclear transport factor 2 family protein [Acidimicrobiia bacterium]